MNAREIIERLARLDEAPVIEPETEPGIDEPMIEPDAPPARPMTRPRPGTSPSPWQVPPDYTPDTFPPGKAEDEGQEIEGWLEATQQPIQDWEWDGENLRLLLHDGTIETYTRQQLEEIGVFGTMSFAEALEIPPFGAARDGELDDQLPMPGDDQGMAMDDGGSFPGGGGTDGDMEFGDLGAPGEPGVADEGGEPQDAVIQGILGTGGCEQAEPMVVTGEPAEKLATAITDVVAAILGMVGGEGASEVGDTSEKDKKEPKDDGDKKGKKEPKDGGKKDKESDDKESDDKE